MLRSFMIGTAHPVSQYYVGDQIREDEMGRACGMYWGEET
jgi:hypothetical protein